MNQQTCQVFLILLTTALVNSFPRADVFLTIPDGILRGRVRYDRFEKEFYSFQDIPYAEPPVGSLRFRDPIPNRPWNGTRDAREAVTECIQISTTTNNITGQEDCLYLNVYTPTINEHHLLPVMVWIHGGGFTSGSGRDNIYGPEFLVAEDVVLVTVNYRLNIFGFFNLDDPSVEAPGNAGLKDQRLALEWVQNNIEFFGGDPKEVTIFGQSAGGASVHLQVLSPQSTGLFSKAIIQSGVATSSWRGGVPNNGEYLARVLGISTDSTIGMFTTLQALPATVIMGGFLLASINYSMRFTSPIAEKNPETAFLADDPMKIIRSGNYNKVPLLIGYTDAEGILYEQLARQAAGQSVPVTDFSIFVPHELLGIEPGTPEALDLTEEVKQFYQCDNPISPDFMEPFIRITTDAYFAFPARRSAVAHSKNNEYPVYFYRFSADTQLNILKVRDPISATFKGAGHADELPYMFKTLQTPEIREGSIEEFAVKRVLLIWSSFAKHSHVFSSDNFSVRNDWKPVMNGIMNYLDIGTYQNVRGVNPDEERMNFWLNIFQRYGVD